MGFDWAKNHHVVVLVDGSGRIVVRLKIDQSAEGWHRLRVQLTEAIGSADLSLVAAAIETNCGPAVERLLEMDCLLYPLNPKAAQRYRDRKAPSGTKTDDLDAWSFADALRTDGHGWKALKPEDPLIQELRLMCRDEVGLIEQRTALVNQLQQALYEYYPAALEAFDDWTMPATWAFIERFSTPTVLAKAGRRKCNAFLHTHKLYRPATYEKRMEIFGRADQFCGSAAVTKAKSMLAMALVKQLRVLQTQLDGYRARIEELFDQHPDHDLFGSLPGAAEKLAPRLLSEFGDDRDRFDGAQAAQCLAGTAPVTYQSGQMHKVVFRRACNKHFRAAMHLWANLSRAKCAWAQAYYQAKRKAGMSHACALRCLGQRWIKIICKMRETKKPYDESLHMRNQVKHGSWVIELTSTTGTTT
ncbi:MAG: IS110 family transposase [Hyphomicrobium sp.]